ncbi:MAG: hypothetical protein ACHP7D_04640 [Lysobacterales bacterium]
MITGYARLLFVLAGLASLMGCIETRFESPPGDNVETCDVRWKGLWTGSEDAQAAQRNATAFHVDDNCAFTVLEQATPGGPLKRTRVPVNYVHANGKDYLVVADTAIKGLVSLRPPHAIDPKPEKSFFFARYRVHGDRIDMYQVDSARVAKLVIDGKLDGTVDKSPNELHVFVRGGRAQMLDVLRGPSVFDESSPLKLVRRGQDLESFERSVRHAAKATPP